MKAIKSIWEEIDGTIRSVRAKEWKSLWEEFRKQMVVFFLFESKSLDSNVTISVEYAPLERYIGRDTFAQEVTFKICDLGIFLNPIKLRSKGISVALPFVPNRTVDFDEFSQSVDAFERGFGDSPVESQSSSSYMLQYYFNDSPLGWEDFSTAMSHIQDRMKDVKNSNFPYLYMFFPVSSPTPDDYVNPHPPSSMFVTADANVVLPSETEIKIASIISRINYIISQSELPQIEAEQEELHFALPDMSLFVGKRKVYAEFSFLFESIKLPAFASDGFFIESIDGLIEIAPKSENTFDVKSKDYCVYKVESGKRISQELIEDTFAEIRLRPELSRISNLWQNHESNLLSHLSNMLSYNREKAFRILPAMIDMFELIYISSGVDIYEPEPLFVIDAYFEPEGLAKEMLHSENLRRRSSEYEDALFDLNK